MRQEENHGGGATVRTKPQLPESGRLRATGPFADCPVQTNEGRLAAAIGQLRALRCASGVESTELCGERHARDCKEPVSNPSGEKTASFGGWIALPAMPS